MLKQALFVTVATSVLAAHLVAQTAKAPAFEVATIRPSGEMNPQMILSGKVRVGMKVDAGRVDIGYFSLRELIPLAYGVKAFQLVGPDWLSAQRYDISATLPEGATKEQVPQMLQSLLAERFHLKAHRENKEQGVYALVQGKDGHKMKPAVEEAITPAAASSETEAKDGKDAKDSKDGKDAPKPSMAVMVNGQQMNIKQTGNGAIVSGGADTGTLKVTMGQGGTMHYEMARVTMPKLVEQLTPLVDKPVIDATELKGAYQVALDLTMQDIIAAARAQGANIPGMPAMPPGVGGGPAASDPGGGSVFSSIQQLGLKLESRKAPIEHVVVESVDKNPTEN